MWFIFKIRKPIFCVRSRTLYIFYSCGTVALFLSGTVFPIWSDVSFGWVHCHFVWVVYCRPFILFVFSLQFSFSQVYSSDLCAVLALFLLCWAHNQFDGVDFFKIKGHTTSQLSDVLVTFLNIYLILCLTFFKSCLFFSPWVMASNGCDCHSGGSHSHRSSWRHNEIFGPLIWVMIVMPTVRYQKPHSRRMAAFF